MKFIINKKEKSKIPSTKLYDLGSVTTDINDLLNTSIIYIDQNIIPILVIDDLNYLINDWNSKNIKESVELNITENDLIPLSSSGSGDVDGVLETKNKLITIPLSDLGVAIEDVTYEMVADYITNLGIVVEKGENYYFEVIEPTYNFDLTSPNWASRGITDEASFINWLGYKGLTNIVVTDFNFVGDRIFCNMTADGTTYSLSNLGLVNADKIGVVNGLTTLNLSNNQIITFNPTIPLPSSLTTLNLTSNQMTLAGYTASEVWANAQPAFTNPCNVNFGGNIDSITGTNLQAILLTKNCVIIS